VWRSGDEFYAWRDLCVHRGTRLSLGRVVDGGRLECPYHGWTYGTDGCCVLMPAHPEQKPPAKARVATFRARAAHGVVWATLGSGTGEIPRFELFEDGKHQVLMAGPYRVHASGPRVVENFLDVGHFPFVHEGILGDRARPEIADYEAVVGPEGVLATGVKVYQPDPYATGQGATVTYTYRVHRPLSAACIKHVNSAPVASPVRNPRRWPTRDLQPFSLRAHGDLPGEQALGQARRRQPGARAPRASRLHRARRPLLRHRAARPSHSALAA